MKFIVLTAWSCLLLFGSQVQARSFSSLAEEQAYIVGEKVQETMACIRRHVQGAALNGSQVNRALAEGIANLSPIEPVLADARLFARRQDRSLEHLDKLDPAGQVQLALGAILAVYGNRDVEPAVRHGANAAMLIHGVEATAGSCVAAAQLTIIRAVAVSILNDSNEDLEFDGSDGAGVAGRCERHDLRAEVLARGRYLVDDVELDHTEFVRMIRSRQEASSNVLCMTLVSEGGGVPVERILALAELGARLSWKRAP